MQLTLLMAPCDTLEVRRRGRASLHVLRQAGTGIVKLNDALIGQHFDE
jgi:hypothetical protein